MYITTQKSPWQIVLAERAPFRTNQRIPSALVHFPHNPIALPEIILFVCLLVYCPLPLVSL